MAQNKYTTKKIENAELSALVSEYLQADHTAKAHAERASKAKAKILAFSEVNPADICHYDVANKTGKVEYKLTYKTHKVVRNAAALEAIAALKAQIKQIEAEYGVDEFWYFGMNEK